jgi:Mg2+ and Co2+ transporter CorA
MDLLQVQEELGIIIQITQQQIDLITSIQEAWKRFQDPTTRSRPQSHASVGAGRRSIGANVFNHPSRATFRQYSSSALMDPMSQVLENLKREFTDLCELRDNCNNLINRTIQLVNIRLEDHGKAILVSLHVFGASLWPSTNLADDMQVFTIVTIVFLPLSFVSSFFGMNTNDIRNMTSNQSIFWIVSCALTVGVVGFTVFLAFYGSAIIEAFFTWKANRSRPAIPKRRANGRLPRIDPGFKNFRVLGIARGENFDRTNI